MSVNAESTAPPTSRRPITRRRILAAPLLAALPLVWSRPARAAETTTLDFEIFRGQEPIGKHTIAFTRDGQRLDVAIEVAVELKLVGVVVYRYSHQGREAWQGAYLQSLETDTDDDGTKSQISGQRVEKGFQVHSMSGTYTVSAGVIPGSYWNSDLVQTNALIDVETGELFDITVEDRGEDVVEAAGENVRAHRFRVKGNRIVHLWYDRSGLVVKMAFETKGEYIEHRLKKIDKA
ncbi:hypothetical protein SAMN06265365_10931 [Tistlia consotensis]|uniref:DUF3108 domain-containing protein n=1 Tax=Tistlia consotensis USBA 355 TaxID=560819 RepID=A0A1Y6CNN9_9PROT|nr:DUF6134 family protein [Tistlia consotensis]SMF80373.1 hypothetical protein SAMN05428998_14131 [Tistlia consotensis USBA 355]SNR62616.1 hypothetical protein SAMN06265365_10931 [Tistlia consotensis]